MNNLLTTAILTFLFVVATAAHGDEPDLIMAIMIDHSASMADGKLDVARREIAQKVHQLPPSSRHRYLLIPFANTVHNAKWFDAGEEELIAHLDQLKAHGGTGIHLAMRYAVRAIAEHDTVPNVIVALYSDGAADDPIATQREIKRLNQMFAERTDRGLSQTVICKQWGNAAGNIITHIKNARVIDAGEAEIRHVTLSPTVRLIDRKWAGKTLLAKLEAQLRLSGEIPDDVTELRITCQTPGVSTKPVLIKGTQPVPFDVEIPITSTTPPSSSIDLEFSVEGAPESFALDHGLLLPTLADNHLSVVVDLPMRFQSVELTNAVLEPEALEWSNPAEWLADATLQLSFNVQEKTKLPLPAPLSFRVQSNIGTLAPESREFQVTAIGDVRVPVVLRSNHLPTPTNVEITVTLIGAPAWGTVTPREFIVGGELVPPARVNTKIAVRPVVVGNPKWVNLRDGIASFDADLSVFVDGPLGQNSQLIVQAPVGVQDLEIKPRRIKPGEQSVRLSLSSALKAAPNVTDIVFSLSSSSAGAIDVQPREPLRISVLGPTPARLVLAQAGRIRHRLVAPLRLDDPATSLVLEPTLIGVNSPKLLDGLQVRLHHGGDIDVTQTGNLRPLVPKTIRIRPAGKTTHSYWRDSTVNGYIEVLPVPRSTAIQGARHEVELRQVAPFKRVLAIVSVIIFIALTICLPTYVMWRLSPPSSVAHANTDSAFKSRLKERSLV